MRHLIRTINFIFLINFQLSLINVFAIDDARIKKAFNGNGSMLALNDAGKNFDDTFGTKLLPRLRIFIVCEDFPMVHTHLALHRALAELLASDEKNVEKVVCTIIQLIN